MTRLEYSRQRAALFDEGKLDADLGLWMREQWLAGDDRTAELLRDWMAQRAGEAAATVG